MTLPVVVDAGSSDLRLGFAGELAPSRTAPSTDPFSLAGLFAENRGQPAFAVVVEKTGRNDPRRQRIVESLFEECRLEAVYFLRAAAGAVYALGRSSGEVLELSESAHEFSTVQDGFVDHSVLLRGECTPTTLFRGLASRFPDWTFPDFRRRLVDGSPLLLPDGSELDLDFYRSDARELVRRGLRTHQPTRPVVLCGRGYLCSAFAAPVLEQLEAGGAAAENLPAWRDLPFIGGSILGSIPEMIDVAVTRAAYAEAGDALLNKLFN